MALTANPWLPHPSWAGIEPTGNMVKKRAEFTVETRSAGQGEVLVYVEDPAGHQEEVRQPEGRAWHFQASMCRGLLRTKTHRLLPTLGQGDRQ